MTNYIATFTDAKSFAKFYTTAKACVFGEPAMYRETGACIVQFSIAVASAKSFVLDFADSLGGVVGEL